MRPGCTAASGWRSHQYVDLMTASIHQNSDVQIGEAPYDTDVQIRLMIHVRLVAAGRADGGHDQAGTEGGVLMSQRATVPRAVAMSGPRAPATRADWPSHHREGLPEARAPSPATEQAGDGALAVSVIAHEVRTPLASLAATSEALLEDFGALDSCQLRDMVSAIRDSTLWLQGLVENLLCAASIQAGRFHMRPEHLNLLHLVMEIQPLMAPLLAQKGQALKLAADRNLPLVLADRRWIRQALVNLLASASKCSAVQCPIILRLTERDGYLRVTVADRGPSLPTGGEMQVFEPYYRGAGTAAVDRGEVGLGLAIVRSVVEAHDGRVGAENRTKGGTRVWLELAAMSSAIQASQRPTA